MCIDIEHKEEIHRKTKILECHARFGLESKKQAVRTFFVITATWIDPQLTARQFINNSKRGRFYALQFIFVLCSYMRKFNYVASKNDMTGEFNERQKTEIKI